MSLHTSEDLYPGLNYVKCDKPNCPFCSPKKGCERCAELERECGGLKADRSILEAKLDTAYADYRAIHALADQFEYDLVQANRSEMFQAKSNDALRVRVQEMEMDMGILRETLKSFRVEWRSKLAREKWGHRASKRKAERHLRLNNELILENRSLKSALRRAIAAAGNPDAAEGCRLVIQIGRDALEAGGGK